MRHFLCCFLVFCALLASSCYTLNDSEMTTQDSTQVDTTLGDMDIL